MEENIKPYLELLKKNSKIIINKSLNYQCLDNFYFKLNQEIRIKVLVSFLMYSNNLKIINTFLFQLEKIYDFNEERTINIINNIFNSYIHNILLHLERKNSEMINILYSDYNNIVDNNFLDKIIIFLSLNIILNENNKDKMNDLVKSIIIYFHKLKLNSKFNTNTLKKNKLHYILKLLQEKYNIEISEFIKKNVENVNVNENIINNIFNYNNKYINNLTQKYMNKNLNNELKMMSKLQKKQNVNNLYDTLIKKYAGVPEKLFVLQNKYYNTKIRINNINLSNINNILNTNNINKLQERYIKLIEKYNDNPIYQERIKQKYENIMKDLMEKLNNLEFKNTQTHPNI